MMLPPSGAPIAPCQLATPDATERALPTSVVNNSPVDLSGMYFITATMGPGTPWIAAPWATPLMTIQP